MHGKQSLNRILAVLLGAGCVLGAQGASAAPVISRLTPPSELFSSGSPAPVIARFLPGQRFDLQATVRPDAGKTITSVTFSVDGQPVKMAPSTTSLVPATALTATVPGAVSASARAYSNHQPGVHILTATATQNDGAVVSATGNFEVIDIDAGGRRAKNIIILLGDGMGAAHRTAARIMSRGYTQGMAKGRLAMDTFPVTGMVMTASLNSIVTDSAPGMSNYVTGNKGANNQEGVFPDDTTDPFDNPRIEYMSEYLHRTQGKSLGLVTTADVFDATPAANAVHTSNRGAGTGIVDQYLDDRLLTGLSVLMGGGRKWFLPAGTPGSQRSNSSDYVLPADIVAGWGAAPGALDPGRDLISDFQAQGFSYAPDNTTLQSLSASRPDKLLGLFSYSNMNVSLDKIGKRRGTSTVVDAYGFPDQPMLDEMTRSALQVLSKNRNGFVAMIEGASIDKQAHNMDSERWILETIEFDRAVQVAKDFAEQNPDTLVIVTADHECSGAAIIGASTVTNAALVAAGGTGTTGLRDKLVGAYDAAGFPKYSINVDGYPATTEIDRKMLIGYGANADRYEDWVINATPLQDSQQPFVGQPPLNSFPKEPINRDTTTGFLVTGQVGGGTAVHTATDIPLSALGRGSRLFTGVMDNTDVFFKIMQVAIGGNREGRRDRDDD